MTTHTHGHQTAPRMRSSLLVPQSGCVFPRRHYRNENTVHKPRAQPNELGILAVLELHRIHECTPNWIKPPPPTPFSVRERKTHTCQLCRISDYNQPSCLPWHLLSTFVVLTEFRLQLLPGRFAAAGAGASAVLRCTGRCRCC